METNPSTLLLTWAASLLVLKEQDHFGMYVICLLFDPAQVSCGLLVMVVDFGGSSCIGLQKLLFHTFVSLRGTFG